MIKLSVNGLDITPLIKGKLISCNLTDERRDLVDQLIIELDNSNDSLMMPEPDAELQLWLPYQGKFVDMGIFKVDTVELSGPPSIISIQARSGDISDSLKQKRDISYSQTTLSTVLTTVASRNSLTPTIANGLGATVIDHLDQTDESDLSFIARMGELYDAVSSIKSNRLIFMPAGQAKTTTGAPITTVNIDLNQCENYRYQKTRITYTGVKAFWNDAAYGKRTPELVGADTNPFIIRGSFRSAALTKNAATAKWTALQREDIHVELSLDHGNPLIITESPLVLQEGFVAEMKALDLITHRIVHSINESGYKTSLEAEKRS
jgi:phage protein D